METRFLGRSRGPRRMFPGGTLQRGRVPDTERRGIMDGIDLDTLALDDPVLPLHSEAAALGPAGKALVPLAVRSSATAEDLPGASFAGQQETYLNVRGEQGLLQAVKRCWSSLWTPRALAYRARQGIDPATVSLAVVAQV